MAEIEVDVLKDEEKFLEVLYSLENKEEIITILKTRLVLGERIPTREIILRSEKNEMQLENLGILNKIKFKYKNLTAGGELELVEVKKEQEFSNIYRSLEGNPMIPDENNNIYFNVYNFIEKYEDKNLTDLYLTKDKKQLYFIDRFRVENGTGRNIKYKRKGGISAVTEAIASRAIISSNTVFALEPEYNRDLIEFIADITLEKNLKDKKSAGYFDF